MNKYKFWEIGLWAIIIIGCCWFMGFLGVKVYQKITFSPDPSVVATETVQQSNKSLLERIEVLEALYVALNDKTNSVKNRPQILIQKAYVTNEKGSITIEEIKENLSKEWKDDKIKGEKK